MSLTPKSNFFEKDSKWLSVNPKSLFRMYDSLLGFGHDFKRLKFQYKTIPGYEIFPEDIDSRDADLKIIAIGGSTSDAIDRAPWPKFLADLLNKKGIKTIIYSGGCGGYNSHQELLKLYRDIYALNPSLVISYSGINDFVGWTCSENPNYNPFHKTIGKFFTENNLIDKSNYGVKNDLNSSTLWLRNGRFMKKFCSLHNSLFVQFLQNTLGSSEYKPNKFEKKLIKACPANYFSSLEEFYEGVRSKIGTKEYSHLIDLSNTFKNKTGYYWDVRHVNDAGNLEIAKHMVSELSKRKIIDD